MTRFNRIGQNPYIDFRILPIVAGKSHFEKSVANLGKLQEGAAIGVVKVSAAECFYGVFYLNYECK